MWVPATSMRARDISGRSAVSRIAYVFTLTSVESRISTLLVINGYLRLASFQSNGRAPTGERTDGAPDAVITLNPCREGKTPV